jgi:decaprenyl-phosphate phosphoribosyltransferase
MTTEAPRAVDYFRLARIDHWPKNIFMVPGVLLAFVYQYKLDTSSEPGGFFATTLASLTVTFIALGLSSSANYTLNEWLDRSHDRFHPTKRLRPSVVLKLNPRIVYIQYSLLVTSSLGLANLVGLGVLLLTLALLVMGVLYNVQPLRLKDLAYFDVIAEAANNPIRMAIGWAAVMGVNLPPASAVLAFWGGGIFLMALKRYSEMIGAELSTDLGRYRKSFRSWTRERLLSFSLFGALICTTFLGVLLAGYRLEYITLVPLIIGLFEHYFRITLNLNTLAQNPQDIFRDKGVNIWVISIVILGLFTTFVDIPFLTSLVGWP